MAQIPQLTARKLLQADAMPNSAIQPYEAAALGQVGAALQDAGGALQARQEQKEGFIAENGYRKFQLDLSQQMEVAKQSAPPDGVGFHDGFLKEVYGPRRDEFLKTVPPRLRSKFETMLADGSGAEFGEWSNRAATVERDTLYSWAKNEVGATQQQLAAALSMNPEQYDEVFKAGNDLIDTMPIPTPEKAVMRAQWEVMAQTVHLNRLMEDSPEAVLKALGANPNMLAPTTQFELVSGAVQGQETGTNPNQISPVGAVGSHQVMPGTAELIAKRMGDAAFPAKGDISEKTAYLLRPGVSKQYGDYHLKWLMKRYPNDLEAVLIGYHSGEGAADEWLAKGRDDAVLGPVGRKYYREVIARLPGGIRADGTQSGGTPMGGTPGSVKLLWVRDGKPEEMVAGNKQLEALNPDLVERVRAGFASAGVSEVRIRSGFRDKEHNAKVGGVKGSMHLDGGAMDIDVSGMSHPERVKLIQGLSAAGITGLGIGANSIHADIGGRRSWGYFSDGRSGAPIPKWAADVVNAHLQGKTAPPRGQMTSASRYGSLPYDKRQQFITSADNALTAKVSAANRASVVDKVAVQNQMEDNLALIRTTGQGRPDFDETKIASTLGEDDYLKWVDKRNEAHRTFTAVQGMKEMTPEQLSDRVDEYQPNPAAADFASQQAIQASVLKEADRISKMRSSRPDKAALEFPEVKSAYEKAVAGIADGKPVAADVQAMVKLMINQQRQFGVRPEAAAPIPREWAFDIGQSLTRVPEMSGRNLEDVRAAVIVQYNSLYEYFGDYTDEVIIYALSQYKGVSQMNADTITGYMKSIQAGNDPFKARNADDAAQVESASDEGWLDWLLKTPAEDVAPAVESGIPSNELILRVVGRLNSIDTPEEEALLVGQYGQAAVNAAKLRIEQGK